MNLYDDLKNISEGKIMCRKILHQFPHFEFYKDYMRLLKNRQKELIKEYYEYKR